jgi:charged multivesicular body protein 7
LRSKKAQEALLTQRSSTLIQLESVLSQIEEAANQVEVVQVLRSSTSVLRGLNAEVGGVESVQDVLDELSAEMASTAEMSDALGDPALSGGVVLDENEIDEELRALEDSARKEKAEEESVAEVRKRLDELPELVNKQPGADAAEKAEGQTEAMET